MRTDAELIELFKPCEQLCKDCGARCCKVLAPNCEHMKHGQCTNRNTWCLMLYCKLIEQAYPDIVEAVKEEMRERFPEAAKRGIQPNCKIELLPGGDKLWSEETRIIKKA
jgi:dihydropteroate synthase